MFTYMTNQPIHNEQYAQSHIIIIIHQHVATTSMTIIRVSYNNAIYIQ
jgi:hypothetical protein